MRDLVLTSEPQAAVIAVAASVPTLSTCNTGNIFDVGKRVLVIDCGGRAVRISAHEVVHSDPLQLTSLAVAIGKDVGGDDVNSNFDHFLRIVVLQKISRQLDEDCYHERLTQFLEVKRQFEAIKQKAQPDSKQPPFTRKLNLLPLLRDESDKAALVKVVEQYNATHPDRKMTV